MESQSINKVIESTPEYKLLTNTAISRKGANNPNVFKAGNQFYKMRTKDGRDKLFNKDNEDGFFNLVYAYIDHCQNKKLHKTDFIKAGDKAGKLIEIPQDRPTSIKGFCAFIGIAHETYLCYEKDEKYSEYSEWFKYARTLLESELQDQALIGNVNPMVAVRVLQLTDRTESKIDVTNTVTSITFVRQAVEDADYTEVNQMLDEE